MNIRLAAVCIVTMTALLVTASCGEPGAPPTPTAVPQVTGDALASSSSASDLSERARAGESAFNANCSVCHGVGAVGTRSGPPLTDGVYHPGHHGDPSFRSAVRNGVPQHHWGFGDMASVPGVSADEVESIICYVREVQRANGLFEGSDYSTVC